MENSELKQIVVFIPAFNEEKSIGAVIDRIHAVYPKEETIRQGFSVHVLVVNDGSTDKTEEIAKQKGVSIISHAKNLGLGAATRTAMEFAHSRGAEVAVKMDADLQHDPADILKVINPILNNEADICWGSRFKGKINYKMPFIRLVGNKFFTWLMNLLTDYDISDAQTGLMAYGKKYLAIFEIFGNYNPPQQILIDANYKLMRYAEVPVLFNKREKGDSFVNFKYPFKVIPSIIRIIIYANPLKVFGFIGSLMMLSSLLITVLWLFGFLLLLPDTTTLILFLAGLQTVFFGILADLLLKKKR